MVLTTLVDVHILAKHLDDPDWVVVDCRFTLTDPSAGRRAYEAGHIPGACYAHLNDDLSSKVTSTTGRHPLPDPERMAETLGAWGIDRQKQVVVYDDAFGAMASRLWWMLRWLGHDAVALLDGGFPRWLRAKLPVTATVPEIQPAFFEARARNELWVGADTVAAASEQGLLVVDARGEERFNGEIEPLDKVAGHVPGAFNAPYEDNLDLSGEFMSDEALREHYSALFNGVSADRVVMMCGSGVTACHNILALEHAGMPGSRLYAGSWSEWITDNRRPVAKAC
jgi:thiosulfate/3-mercaptopyruvate sulfurtransferase